MFKQKTEPGRALSFCAGMTLKEAMEEAGYSLKDLSVEIEDKGKPKAEGVSFSLSHSGKVAMAAVSDENLPIGCDVQKLEDKPVSQNIKIAKRFFSVTEVQILQEILQKSEEHFKKLFYMIFSAKESYIKKTGEGLSRGLNTFDIPIDETLIEAVNDKESEVIEILTGIDGEMVRFSYFLSPVIGNPKNNDFEYVACVCEDVINQQ